MASRSKVEALDSKLDALIAHVASIGDTMTQSMTRIEEHICALEERVTSIESHPTATDERVKATEENITAAVDNMKDIRDSLTGIQDHLNKMAKSNQSTQTTVNEMCDNLSVLTLLMDWSCNWSELNVEILLQILPMAGRLRLKNWVVKMTTMLINALTVTNCLVLFHFSRQNKLDDLQDSVLKMICQNFVQVSEKNEDFCGLTLEELEMILFSDLIRATEEHVMAAIVRWTCQDSTNRRALASQLLPAVRLGNCNLSFLRKLEQHPLVLEHKDFLVMVWGRISELMTSGSCFDLWLQAGDRELWRWPPPPDVLFIVGGYGSEGVVETLCTATGNTWIKHKIPDAPSKDSWVCSLAHQILVIEESEKRFRSFDTLNKTWTKRTLFPDFRGGMCLAREGMQLYAMGGHFDCLELHGNKCNRYDIAKDEWTEVASMRVGRYCASATSLSGHLYCSGGQESVGFQQLSSVEKYNPMDDKWSPALPMGVARSQHCLVSCGKFLWAVGGFDGKDYLTDVERFDPVTNSWSSSRPMPTAKSCLSACFHTGLLCVSGGWKGGQLFTVEVYNPTTDSWMACHPLSVKRNWHGSCIVKDLFVADEYNVTSQPTAEVTAHSENIPAPGPPPMRSAWGTPGSTMGNKPWTPGTPIILKDPRSTDCHRTWWNFPRS